MSYSYTLVHAMIFFWGIWTMLACCADRFHPTHLALSWPAFLIRLFATYLMAWGLVGLLK